MHNLNRIDTLWLMFRLATFRRPPFPLIRFCDRSSSGWDGGDIDDAINLLTHEYIDSGSWVSKDSRDHFMRNGYVGFDGNKGYYVTPRGRWAALTQWPMPRVHYRRWRRKLGK